MRRAILLSVILLAAGPALGADVTVREANLQFDRQAVTLKAGDALVVTNEDAGDHDLRLVDQDGDPQDMGLQKPGKAIRLTFPNPGSYRIRCTITPDMRLAVVVN